MRAERQVLFWTAALMALILAIGLLKDILLPFVVGIVVAYFLNPIAERLTEWGLPRVWASVLIVAAGAAVMIAAFVFLIPLLAAQLQQLAASLPAEIERTKALVEAWARERLGSRFPEFEAGLDRASRSLSENWTSLAGWLASSLWTRSLALFNFLSLMLVTPLVVFYLLVDWHPMVQKVDRWLPREHAPTIRRIAGDINEAISAFIRGQGTVCLVLAAFYATLLSLLGLRYGLLIGLATGIMSFVPFVGWALGLVVSLSLAFVQFWPDAVKIALVGGVFLAGQALDAALLSPKIVGSKIGLHPVWLIFALFVFSYLFGFVGVLVAVPVAAAIAVLVRFALDVYLKSQVYTGAPSPPAVDGRPKS